MIVFRPPENTKSRSENRCGIVFQLFFTLAGTWSL